MSSSYLNEPVQIKNQRNGSSSAGHDWIRSAAGMICSFGVDGSICQVSERWLIKLGYERDPIVGANFVQFLVPSSQSYVEAVTLPGLFESGRSEGIEWTLRSQSGEPIEMLVSAEVIKDICGPLAIVFFMDVSIQKMAERKLVESEARFRMLAEQSMDMMFQLDENLVWKYVSPACREIAGYDPEFLIGKIAFQKLHSEEEENVRRVFGDVAAGREQHGSLVYRVWHADGRWIWVNTRFRGTRRNVTGEPTGLVGMLRDVTEKKEIEESLAKSNQQLEILASHDSLTEIYNRRAFDEIFAREIKIAVRERTTLTLLMIDVDYFKAYNDQYGHPTGDTALRNVSAAIQASIHRPSDVAARYGGEEFVVLLPNTDEAGGNVIASAIQTSIRALQLKNERSPHSVLTVSIGVASDRHSALNSRGREVLLNRADIALYLAKDKGRDSIVVWTAHKDVLREFVDLIMEIISTDDHTSLDAILAIVDDYVAHFSQLSLSSEVDIRHDLVEAVASSSPTNSISNMALEIIKDRLRH